ncbi:MAG TPA: histidinol dehydrogenase [Eubacteriaceae bacterium]|jgi:histidinol dehydrogenase|nr:histidinol dehydrogenase [Eubacteriaceae bacterium]
MIQIIEGANEIEKLEKILNRTSMDAEGVLKKVDQIIKDVRESGDKAVIKYTQLYDGNMLEDIKVSKEEIEDAKKIISKDLIKAIENAIDNIYKFHRKQIENGFIIEQGEGVMLGQIINPIERIGVYIPGGTASYPSTVMMNVIPANIAGVKKIIIVTPADEDGKVKESILVTADLLGVNEIYKIGGAQAIAALCYGTETIPKVDKIVGPGNIYVAMAKQKVAGMVGIDMIAGPSEVVILADETANAKFIAADLIAQAEHDTRAASILVTDSKELKDKVLDQLKCQMHTLQRREIAEKSLAHYGAIIITKDIKEGKVIVNRLAPEHLEIMTRNPMEDYSDIQNAGAIFLGKYTPEAVGDYYAGSNHTLPTSRTARFSSALGVYDFIKRTSLVYYSRGALINAGPDIISLAKEESLTGHANSIKVRLEEEDV